jgi:cytochrome c oxidase cbb3-type subunit 3
MKSLKYIFTLLFLGSASLLMAQANMPAPDAATEPNQLGSIMTLVLITAAALLFIVAMVYVIKVNQFLYKRVVSLQAEKSGITLEELAAAAAPSGDSLWDKFRKTFWEDAVPIDREEEILKDHAYDGIRELDNTLPPWWVNMFILTIIFAVVYMFYYHWGGDGPNQAKEYEMEMEQAKKEMAIALAGAANRVDEESVVQLTESGPLGDGQLIFSTNCTPCHGQAGEGNTIGPNLTDAYWLHGGGIKNVFRTIKNGVPEKGMIAWSAQLTPSDIQKVASYILTLQGTNPPNPKEAQGELWQEEAAPAEMPSDSTAVSE